MEYLAPKSLAEALEVKQDRSVAIVAGGTDFYPAFRPSKRTGDLLDLTQVAEMQGITNSSEGWRIGGATTWTAIARAELPLAFAGLQCAARQVGSIQIQNTGTIAGNLCNASPAADGVPPLLTLNAEVELASARRSRRLPLSDFLRGPRQTALTHDELLVAVHIPATSEASTSSFEKLGSRAYLVISIAMTAVVLHLENGLITDLRIAVGACSAVAQRLPALEMAALGKNFQTIEITPDHLAPLAPIDDVRAGAAYRLNAVVEQCRRAIQTAGELRGAA